MPDSFHVTVAKRQVVLSVVPILYSAPDLVPIIGFPAKLSSIDPSQDVVREEHFPRVEVPLVVHTGGRWFHEHVAVAQRDHFGGIAHGGNRNGKTVKAEAKLRRRPWKRRPVYARNVPTVAAEIDWKRPGARIVRMSIQHGDTFIARTAKNAACPRRPDLSSQQHSPSCPERPETSPGGCQPTSPKRRGGRVGAALLEVHLQTESDLPQVALAAGGVRGLFG